MRERKMEFIIGDLMVSIASSDKTGMQFIKEDGYVFDGNATLMESSRSFKFACRQCS